jgi:hypothetical protein
LELRHGFNVGSFQKAGRFSRIPKCRKFGAARRVILRTQIDPNINLNFEVQLHDMLEPSAEKPWLNRIRGANPRERKLKSCAFAQSRAFLSDPIAAKSDGTGNA